jgi:hypothetical protein
MQRVEIAGVGRQNRSVDSFGFCEANLLMERKSLLNGICWMRTPSGCMLGHA